MLAARSRGFIANTTLAWRRTHGRVGTGRPDARQRQLADSLRNELGALEPLPAAASDAEAAWTDFRRQLRRDARRRDPRFFTTWPVIRRAMFLDVGPYIDVELRTVEQDQTLRSLLFEDP